MRRVGNMAIAAAALLAATAAPADGEAAAPDRAFRRRRWSARSLRTGSRCSTTTPRLRGSTPHGAPSSTTSCSGVDAPPLNDDDADGVPDYVERVGDAADTAIAYYERRGFARILPDAAGPDVRPDLYISRFAPGYFGVAFPAADAEGGAFVAVSNALDPSPATSLGSLYGTVAHELFHLMQFSYFPPHGRSRARRSGRSRGWRRRWRAASTPTWTTSSRRCSSDAGSRRRSGA